MLSRRKLITGLISFIAAPAIVKASSLMPVKMVVFNLQEAFDKLLIPYKLTMGSKLYWINSDGEMVVLPILDSELYLGRFNDYT